MAGGSGDRRLDDAGAVSATRGIGRPINFSMSRKNSRSSTSQNDTATPVLPARAVRPIRCT